MRRLRDAWVLAAVVFLVASSYVAFFAWNGLRVDATAYWDAGTRLRLGTALYATAPVAALDKAYLYPPAFAAVFAPLTALPPVWGYGVWMTCELVFLLALGRVCAELAGLRGDDRDGRRTALALALAAGFVPVFDNLAEGQVNLLVALLCALAVREAERGRPARAAFALAGAVHVKLVPIVLVGAFAVWRRPRVVAWSAVALVALALLPLPWRIATHGVGGGVAACARDHVDFVQAILWPATSSQSIAGVEQFFAPNFSLRGTASRLFVAGTPLSPFPASADRRGPLVIALPPGLVHAGATGLGLAAIVAALWSCVRAAADPARRVAAAGLLVLAGMLAGPTFWQHHFVGLGLLGAGLWRVLATASRRAQVLAWAGAIGPLVLTVSVPFVGALVSRSFEQGVYREVRELGLPTLAAVAVFVIGVILVLRPPPRRA